MMKKMLYFHHRSPICLQRKRPIHFWSYETSKHHARCEFCHSKINFLRTGDSLSSLANKSICDEWSFERCCNCGCNCLAIHAGNIVSEMETTCGSCLAYTTDGVDVYQPYRDTFNLPQIIADYIGIKISKNKRRNRLPLCFNCANRLVDIDEFCTMYRETQVKLQSNLASCLKRRTDARSDEFDGDGDSDALSGSSSDWERQPAEQFDAGQPSGPETFPIWTGDAWSVADDVGNGSGADQSRNASMEATQPTMRNTRRCAKTKPPRPTRSPVTEIVHSARVSANIAGAMRTTAVRRQRVARESVGYILYSSAVSFRTHDCEMCSERFVSAAFLRQHLIDQHAIVECTGEDVDARENAMAGSSRGVADDLPTVSVAASKPLLCDVCGYACASPSTMRNHLRRHNNDKQFKCAHCEMAFVCNSALQRHIRARHTDPERRRHACDVCDRRFVTTTHLQAHQAVHSKRKAFHCNLCGLAFAFKNNLITHQRRHEQSQFPCDDCAKVFISKKDRTIHVRQEHLDANVVCTVD